MALQLNKQVEAFGQSVTIPSAYAKVSSIKGNKETILITVEYKSNDKIVLFEDYKFNPSVLDDAENFIKQAYEHLKTLPEFAGAADV